MGEPEDDLDARLARGASREQPEVAVAGRRGLETDLVRAGTDLLRRKPPVGHEFRARRSLVGKEAVERTLRVGQ